MNSAKLPTISNYYCYSSDNYGAHSLRVDIPPTRKTAKGITLYYSYSTIIAYRQSGELVARVNDWGNTTGKHLNSLEPNKSARLKGADFEKALLKAMKRA